jgi:hypothetical protein
MPRTRVLVGWRATCNALTWNIMSKRLSVGVLLSISMVGVAGGLGLAQPVDAGRHSRVASSAADEPAIDPAAMRALKRMGAFLRKQDSFSVRGKTLTDQVLDNGQKVELAGKVDLLVNRPDGLRAEITTDRKRRTLVYDGKTFTVYGKGSGYYASFAAPPTLRQVVEVAKARYDIDVPFADLFYWGTDEDGSAKIKSAMDIGPSRIDGRLCEHYAFRQDDVDWQIWIQSGTEPLPCKFVVTTRTERAQPQHSVTMTWDLDPKLPASFTFMPPKGSHRIALEGYIEESGS